MLKITNVFDEMGNYWAEMADQNATDLQIKFIKRILSNNGLVLDLACGTGRHLISLSEDAYDVVGLDISVKLLKIAKSRRGDIQVVRADMCSLPFKPNVFSTVLSIDTSFGYLPAMQDDSLSLGQLFEALSKESIVVIDVFNGDNLVQKYAGNMNLKWKFLLGLLKFNNSFSRWLLTNFFSWIEFPSFFLLKTRKVTEDKDSSKLQDLWVICDKISRQIIFFAHVVRLYGLKQLTLVLENAGFAVKQVYGDYEGQPFSPNSSRLILVASKN